jgi:hypothetical protein
VALAGIPLDDPEQIFNQKNVHTRRLTVGTSCQNPQILREADFPPEARRLHFLGLRSISEWLSARSVSDHSNREIAFRYQRIPESRAVPSRCKSFSSKLLSSLNRAFRPPLNRRRFLAVAILARQPNPSYG